MGLKTAPLRSSRAGEGPSDSNSDVCASTPYLRLPLCTRWFTENLERWHIQRGFSPSSEHAKLCSEWGHPTAFKSIHPKPTKLLYKARGRHVKKPQNFFFYMTRHAQRRRRRRDAKSPKSGAQPFVCSLLELQLVRPGRLSLNLKSCLLHRHKTLGRGEKKNKGGRGGQRQDIRGDGLSIDAGRDDEYALVCARCRAPSLRAW